jgi:hypothetical protein
MAGDAGSGIEMRPLVLNLVVWPLVAGTAFTLQTMPLPLGARLTMRWDEKSVTLYEGKQKHTIALNDEIDASEIDSVKLQSAKQSGNHIYLLLDVTGPSRGRGAGGSFCGAGQESDLIWVQLDSKWSVEDIQSFLYYSCIHSVETLEEPSWTGPILEAKSDNYSDRVEETARYTLNKPENGIQISSVPLKN